MSIRVCAEVDRRITVRSVISMDEQVARAFNIERLIARLTISFGLVALMLACFGLYGVTAYSVSRRTVLRPLLNPPRASGR